MSQGAGGISFVSFGLSSFLVGKWWRDLACGRQLTNITEVGYTLYVAHDWHHQEMAVPKL